MKKNFVEVDGSLMEGGGSILRLTSALSVLTQKPVRIFNIRSKRPQPGIRTQHLRGLEATAAMSGGRVDGAKIGATEVLFYPGKETLDELSVPIETAGSVGLVFQSILLSLVKSKKKTAITVDGGATFGKYAPPLQYIQFVLLPHLRRMGYHSEINIIRHGFFPSGGALTKLMVHPVEELMPINLTDPGKVESVDVVSVAAMHLKNPRVSERQYREVEFMLKKHDYKLNIKSKYSDTRCPGSGVVLVARTDTGCIIGSDGLGERGRSSEEVAAEAVNKLNKTTYANACVDEYMGDQLLPYMALANGKSSIKVPEVSSHAETNIHILEQFTNARFEIEKDGAAFIIKTI